MNKFLKWCATYLVPTFIIGVVVALCISFLLDNLPYDNSALDVDLEQEKFVINNTLLMNDTVGKTLSVENMKVGTNGYVEFEVASKADGKVKFEVYLTKEDADPEIDSKFVKVYLTDENDKAIAGFDSASIPTYYDLRVSEIDPSARVLYSGSLKNKESRKFKFRVWTADTYELTAETKIFSIKLGVGVK